MSSRLASVPRPAALIVAFAVCLAIGHFIFLLSDYKNVFVHPDFHQDALRKSLRGGLAFGLHDFVNGLQQRAPNEFRPRWLTYFLEGIDHKLRLRLYEWMPIHPTLGPLTWPIQLLIPPFLLYRLLVSLTADRIAALAGIAVYLSSNGFLSGFTMTLMPGKTLSNLVTIAAFYAALVAAQRLRPGQFLVESSGPAKYLLAVILTLGLFLDELPAVLFLMVPIVFWRHCFPQSLSVQQGIRFVRNGLLFGAPVLSFLFLVLVVFPPITERYLGYRFNYLSEIFFLDGNTRTGTSWLVGVRATLTPTLAIENVTTLWGVSLAPWFISPLLEMEWGAYPTNQVNNLPKLAIFLAFFGAVLFIAMRARGRFGTYFRGLLAALVAFQLFMIILSIRHIPVVTGFYYGASFASLFAILVGMMVAGIARVAPRAQPYTALALLGIVATQIVNFWPINDGWKYAHNEVMAHARVLMQTPRFQRRYPLEPERPLTMSEVNGIWAAWKQGQMQPYIEANRVGPAATYLVFELRELDRQLERQSRHDDD